MKDILSHNAATWKYSMFRWQPQYFLVGWSQGWGRYILCRFGYKASRTGDTQTRNTLAHAGRESRRVRHKEDKVGGTLIGFSGSRWPWTPPWRGTSYNLAF